MKKFRTFLDHDRPISPHGGVSMTDQQYKRDCDINVILERYQATGRPPVTPTSVYGDFADIGDFTDCIEKVSRATSDFAALPSDLRARFGNDPKLFVDFVLNPENNAECVSLGLRVVAPKPEEKPIDVLRRIEKCVTSNEAKPAQ